MLLLPAKVEVCGGTETLQLQDATDGKIRQADQRLSSYIWRL